MNSKPKKLNIINPPMCYINQQNVDRFAIALCFEIPYPLLVFWHGMAGQKDSQGDSLDYLDLLNSWIPSGWFQVSRATGFRIQERLRQEVGCVVNKYKSATGSKTRREFDGKVYSLNILVNELMSIKEMVDKAEHASQLVEEWRRKYSHLEEEKNSLAQEMVQALSKKDQELEYLNKELSDYIEKVTNLEKLSCVNGKPFNCLGQRQKVRQIKELKEKADVALWFLETYGLKLSSLKVKEMESSDTYALDFPSDNAVKDEETIEQVLFLLDKFCASDELYHEFTLAYDNLPRSYLVKQKRSELNKLCHIEKVPGQFPGAQISFSETLKDHIREFLKSHPDHDVTDDPIKVKISADGAKMSKTTNFMILSFALLQTGKNVMSSSGNRSLAIVNGPKKYNTLASSSATVINDINSVAKNAKINVDGKDIPVKMSLGGGIINSF